MTKLRSRQKRRAEYPKAVSVETYTTVVEAPAKKYRPGPKSRKRFLEIKDDLSGEASPNKRAKCDPQLEAFVKVLSIKARTGERPLAEGKLPPLLLLITDNSVE